MSALPPPKVSSCEAVGTREALGKTAWYDGGPGRARYPVRWCSAALEEREKDRGEVELELEEIALRRVHAGGTVELGSHSGHPT